MFSSFLVMQFTKDTKPAEQAKIQRNNDPFCTILEDYYCNNPGWRICTSTIEAMQIPRSDTFVCRTSVKWQATA